MPTCTAFTKRSTPCTSNIHEGQTLCGIHRHMIENDAAQIRFNREQAVYRTNWERLQAGTHVRVGTRIVPVDAPLQAGVREPPPPRPRLPQRPCMAIKADGTLCHKAAQHDDQRCNLHHGVALRHIQNDLLAQARRYLVNIYTTHRFNPRVYRATVAEAMPRLIEGLNEQSQRRLREQAEELIQRPLFQHLLRLIDILGATFEQADAQVQAWVVDGSIAMVFVPRLHDFIHRHIQLREWQGQHQRPAQFGAHQREAQLAADSQNVHTREITQQMKDSINLLLAVEIPSGYTGLTVREMRVCWLEAGYSLYEIDTVYRDVVFWWNKDMIYSAGDKLYRRMLRGLWWTIKQYKEDVRKELEKRLWEELRDGAIPYSVCTQGHVARLSNVMIGFDEAFVPPVPVGEVLQQKMAAIYGMDVDYEEQMRLATDVLVELKIPREQYAEWLSAF
jgi:hypothetical protein